MPSNPGENITSFTGEQSGDTSRATYEGRGEKVLSTLSVDEILSLNRSELEKYSLAEIMEAKSRLEAEYRSRYGEDYQPQSEQSQPEQTTEQPSQQPAPVGSQPVPVQGSEAAPTPAQSTETDQSTDATEVDARASDIVDNAIAAAAAATASATAAEIIAASDAPASTEAQPVSANIDTQPTPGTTGNQAPAQPTTSETATETITVEEARAICEKAKRKPSLKRFFIGKLAPIALGAAILFGFGAKANTPTRRDTGPQTSNEQQLDSSTPSIIGQSAEAIIAASNEANADADAIADSEFAGELPNGVTYDYSHYADRDNKESYNAFDYDMSEYFNDVDGTKESFMKVASTTPEALAAYSYSIFNADEKAKLGIDGMTASQIDDYISNDANGGAMQQRLLAALQDVLDDDNTQLNFYYENGVEKTHYIYFVDDNENGKMDPGEMHLAYDIKDRENAPQVDIIRNGQKVLDLNMLCGYQPNFEQAPEGVPHVPSDEQTDEHHNDKTGSEGTKTGREGTKTGSEGTKTGSEGTKTGNEGTKTGSEDTGSEGTGSEGTGSEGTDVTGSEGTGSEGTGSEGTGSEGTGSEGTDVTGSEGTNPDSGSEGTDVTGSEGTNPDSGSEGTDVTGSEGTNPDSGSEGTDLTPKNEEAERENAGDRVDVRDLDEDVTPSTTKEEDEANFDAIEKQRQEDEKKKEEDEKTAAEQAEKERQAAKEAEERREREAREKAAQEEAERQKEREREAKAEEARQKAEAEAERKQREAEEREREAQKEREEREAEQRKADEEEKQHEEEAESKKDDSAAERANSFEEGDY